MATKLRATQLGTLRAVEQLESEALHAQPRRVARRLGCTRASAVARLERLVAQGYLKDNSAAPRYRVYSLTDEGRAASNQPLEGGER